MESSECWQVLNDAGRVMDTGSPGQLEDASFPSQTSALDAASQAILRMSGRGSLRVVRCVQTVTHTVTVDTTVNIRDISPEVTASPAG